MSCLIIGIFIVSERVKWSVSKCVISLIYIIKFYFDDDITRSNVLPDELVGVYSTIYTTIVIYCMELEEANISVKEMEDDICLLTLKLNAPIIIILLDGSDEKSSYLLLINEI